MAILSGPLYQGFGPALPAECLRTQHDNLTVSTETLRQWIVKAGSHKAGRQRRTEVQAWRLRRSLLRELIQQDTSEHDWSQPRRLGFWISPRERDLPKNRLHRNTQFTDAPSK